MKKLFIEILITAKWNAIIVLIAFTVFSMSKFKETQILKEKTAAVIMIIIAITIIALLIYVFR